MEAVFPNKHLPVWIDCPHSAQTLQSSSESINAFTLDNRVIPSDSRHQTHAGPEATPTTGPAPEGPELFGQQLQTTASSVRTACCWTSGFTRHRESKKTTWWYQFGSFGHSQIYFKLNTSFEVPFLYNWDSFYSYIKCFIFFILFRVI